MGDDFGEPGAEELGTAQIAQADRVRAARLIAIARTDAPHRGADRVRLAALFEHGLFQRVIGEDHVGPVADQQVAVDVAAVAGDRVDLFQEGPGIDDDSGGDDGHDPGCRMPAGSCDSLYVCAVEDDGMAGVVAPLIADDDVVFVGQQIDDFSLGFVAPLQTDNRRGRHEIASSIFQWTPEEERPRRSFRLVTAGEKTWHLGSEPVSDEEHASQRPRANPNSLYHLSAFREPRTRDRRATGHPHHRMVGPATRGMSHFGPISFERLPWQAYRI